ncbi:MAG: glycerol-3-phosphate 1-O-acyltransferase PlsY [Kofleriaceae bacterium]
MVLALGLILLGLLAGAIPFGVIVARSRGVAIRNHGSGNIGATNVTRVVGPGAGVIVLVLDGAKGAVPTALASHYTTDPWLTVATAAAAILGHCFSPFLRFKGGKGVATTFGVFVAISPIIAVAGAAVFAGILAITRVPALASLAAVATMVALLLGVEDLPWSAFGVGCLALVIYTHRTNLQQARRPPAA